MAYSKTEWKARQGVNLNKFTKSQEAENSVLLTNTPDSITEPGTSFSAENMNHIEEGIADAHDAIEQEVVDRDTAITEAVNTEAADRQEQAAETNTRIAALETNDAVQDSDIAQIWDQINQTKHFRGYYATLAEIQALENPAGGDYAYCAEIVASSTTSNEWIFDSDTSTWIDTGRAIPDQLSPPSDEQPLMDGENSNPGTSNEYSRGDHIHPRHPDTSFIYTDPETGERYDNEQLYGMVKNVEVDKFEEGKSGTIVGASEEDGIGYVRATPDGKGQVIGLVELNSLLSIGPPDTSKMETINRISTNNGTWTVPPGYNGWVRCRIDLNAVDPSAGYMTTARFLVNNIELFSNTWVYHVSNAIATMRIMEGDVVKISGNGYEGSPSNISCYFIPPVIQPPAYLEAMPHLDYSTVEQDTYTKWIDGKEIYQKTIQITIPSISANTFGTIGTVANLIPGATAILDVKVLSGSTYYGYFDATINNGNIQIRRATQVASLDCRITFWYVK